MVKNDDVLQLKQMIIFLKAELIKYETMDHVSEMNRLKQENRQLADENEALRERLNNKKHVSLDWTVIHEKLDEVMKMMEENTRLEKVIERLMGEKEKEKVVMKHLQKENAKLSMQMNKISPAAIREMDIEMKKVVQEALLFRSQLAEKTAMLKQLEKEFMNEIALKNGLGGEA